MVVSKYSKPAELLAEWEALGTPAAPGFYERLASISIETLVTACRVYGRVHGDRLYEALVARVTPKFGVAVRRLEAAKGHALSAYDREEVEEALAQAFWEKVLAGESFFEIRFNRALRDLTLSVYRDTIQKKQRARERAAARVVVRDGDDPVEPWAIDQDQLPDTADRSDMVIGEVVVEALLAHLPEETAQAIALHVLMDLKISSNDAHQPTVASVLGCSERKARQLIADGFVLLRQLSGGDVGDG